jgi:hypothetical protein
MKSREDWMEEYGIVDEGNIVDDEDLEMVEDLQDEDNKK